LTNPVEARGGPTLVRARVHARAILATIHAEVIGDRKASRALTGTAEMLQARLHLRPRSCDD